VKDIQGVLNASGKDISKDDCAQVEQRELNILKNKDALERVMS
jgi:hypothetical protein